MDVVKPGSEEPDPGEKDLVVCAKDDLVSDFARRNGVPGENPERARV